MSIDQTAFIQLLTRDSSILHDVEQFINYIIKFNHCSVLVTSLDFFAHNQPLTDDCAFGILPSDISLTPSAKVKAKNNMNKQFKELSIFIGLYELLVVGGYILKDNTITPFLGSSLGNNHLEDTTTNEIHVVTSKLPIIKTSRILNQYLKRCSNNPWSYHCFASFSKDFYPIVATDYLNHSSQRHRSVNTHHLASNVLALISSTNVIKEEDIRSLWSLVTRLPPYEAMVKNENTRPITFTQLAALSSNANGQYFKSILDIVASIESIVPCYMLGAYGHNETRKITLQIMKNGLKEEIRKQQLHFLVYVLY